MVRSDETGHSGRAPPRDLRSGRSAGGGLVRGGELGATWRLAVAGLALWSLGPGCSRRTGSRRACRVGSRGSFGRGQQERVRHGDGAPSGAGNSRPRKCRTTQSVTRASGMVVSAPVVACATLPSRPIKKRYVDPPDELRIARAAGLVAFVKLVGARANGLRDQLGRQATRDSRSTPPPSTGWMVPGDSGCLTRSCTSGRPCSSGRVVRAFKVPPTRENGASSATTSAAGCKGGHSRKRSAAMAVHQCSPGPAATRPMRVADSSSPGSFGRLRRRSVCSQELDGVLCESGGAGSRWAMNKGTGAGLPGKRAWSAIDFSPRANTESGQPRVGGAQNRALQPSSTHVFRDAEVVRPPRPSSCAFIASVSESSRRGAPRSSEARGRSSRSTRSASRLRRGGSSAALSGRGGAGVVAGDCPGGGCGVGGGA